MRDFGHLLGYDENANYRYRILTIDGRLRFRQIDGEQDVMDMANISKKLEKLNFTLSMCFILDPWNLARTRKLSRVKVRMKKKIWCMWTSHLMNFLAMKNL